MKKVTTVLSLLVFTLLFSACQKETLQSYLVEAQEKEGFITIDIPVSFLQPKNDEVPQDIKETIKSIRKINLVVMPVKNNEEAYEVEKTKIAQILKNSDEYKSLMRMNLQGYKVNLYYSGEADAIDEVVAFGYSDGKGVGVARILGENIDPSKIIEAAQNMKMDGDAIDLKQLNALF